MVSMLFGGIIKSMAIAKHKKRFKSFNSTPLEPLGFTLNGQDFTVYPELDYRRYKQLVEDLEDSQNGIDSMISNITDFIASDEDREAFMALIEDENIIIPANTIVEIWRYILTEYKVIETPKEQ